MTKTKVFVWPGCVVKDSDHENFKEFFDTEFGLDAKFIDQVETNPNSDANGVSIDGTGGRKDAFFQVTATDEQFEDQKWMMGRLLMGIVDWNSARPMLKEKGMEYIYSESVYERFPVSEVAEG